MKTHSPPTRVKLKPKWSNSQKADHKRRKEEGEKKEVDDDDDFTDVDRLLKMTLIHSTEADHLDEDDNVFYGNGPLVEDAASY